MPAPKLDPNSAVAPIAYRDSKGRLKIHVFVNGGEQQLHNCTFDETSGLWQWNDVPALPNSNLVHTVLGATTCAVAGVQFVFTFVHVVPENTIHVRISQEGIQASWQSIKKAQAHLQVSPMSLITYDDGAPQSYGWCTSDSGDLVRVHGNWFGGTVTFEETNAGKPGGNSVPVFGRPAAITFLSADQTPQHEVEVYVLGSVPHSGNQLCCDLRAVSADTNQLGSTWIWNILGTPVNQNPSVLLPLGVAADLPNSVGSPGQPSVYVTGTPGALWRFTKPWTWKSLAAPANTTVEGVPAAVSYQANLNGILLNVEHVLVGCHDGSIYEINPVGPWIKLGNPGTLVGNPHAITIPPAKPGHLGPIASPVHVYCVGQDGRLYASTKQSNGQFVWSAPLGV